MKVGQAIPLLRIFSVERAREFYLDYLGFLELTDPFGNRLRFNEYGGATGG